MKKYYYIGVIKNDINSDAISYVYTIGEGKVAYWKPYSELRKENLKPKRFTKSTAENIVYGLNCNFILAFVITSHTELN